MDPYGLDNLRRQESHLDVSGLPSDEAKHPRLALNLTGDDLVSDDPTGRRTSERVGMGKYVKPEEEESREEIKLWNHVKHLETQLELLAASHDGKGSSYNNQLTSTMVGLAVNAEEQQPSPLRAQHSIVDGAKGAPADDKKLWNTWDLRLNIGLQVGKWFGHQFQTPTYREDLAEPVDLGTDPNKQQESSLSYTEVHEINKRISTIALLAELMEKLEEGEKSWKDSIINIKKLQQPAASSASKHRSTLAPDIQDRLASQLSGVNSSFLRRVDELLHEILNVADIWGEKDRIQEQLGKMSNDLMEYQSRMGKEMEGRRVVTSQASEIAQRLGDEQARTVELQKDLEREMSRRNSAEALRGSTEEELRAVRKQLADANEDIGGLRQQLNEARQQGFQVREDLARVASTKEDVDRTVENMNKALENEKRIRDRLARETADVQIELAKWREDCEMERNNVFELRKSNEDLKERMRTLQNELEQTTEQYTTQLVRVTELRLKNEELVKVNKLIETERDESRIEKDYVDKIKDDRVEEALSYQSGLQSEVRRLQDQLSDAQRKHRELNAQNEKLFDELETAQNSVETDSVIAELRRMLAQALSEKQSLDNLCTQLRQNEADMQREAMLRQQAHQGEIDRLSEQLRTAVDESDSVAKKLNAAHGEHNVLNKKLQERNQTAMQNQMSMDELKTQIDELKRMVQALTAEKEVLRTQLSEFEGEFEREVHNRAVKSEEASKTERIANEWRSKYEHEAMLRSDSERARRQLEDEKLSLAAQLSRVTVEQTSTFHSMDEMQREYQAARRARDQSVKHRDDALEDVQKLQRLLDVATNERNELEHKENDLKRQLAVESFQRQENEKKLEEAMREMNTINGHLTHLKQTKMNLESQLQHLRTKLEMDNTERLELNVHASSLERMNAKSREDMDDLKTQLERQVKETEKTNLALENTRAELELMQKAHRSQKDQFDQMLRENAEMVNSNKNLESEMIRARKRMQQDIAEKDSMARGMDAKDSEIGAYRKQLDNLLAEKHSTDKEMTKLQEIVRGNSKERSSFELEKLQIAQELADARRRLDAQEKEHLRLMDAWNDDKKRYERKLIDLEEGNKMSLKKQQDDLDMAHLSMQQLVAQSGLKYKAFEDEVEHYKHQVHSGLLKEEDLSERFIAVTQSNDRLTTDLQSAVTNQERLEDDLQHIRGKLKKLQAQYDAVFQELENAQTELQQNDKARDMVVRARDTSEKKVEELKQLLADAERKCMEAKRQGRESEIKVTQLSNDNAGMELELQRLAQQLEKAVYASNTVGKDMDEYRQNVSTLLKEKTSLQLSLDSAQAEVTNYIKKVKELLAAQSDLTLENQTLQAELERVQRSNTDLNAKSNSRKQQIDAAEVELLDFRKRLGSYLSPPAPPPRTPSVTSLPRRDLDAASVRSGASQPSSSRAQPSATPSRYVIAPRDDLSMREYTARGSGYPARSPT